MKIMKKLVKKPKKLKTLATLDIALYVHFILSYVFIFTYFHITELQNGQK